MRESKALRLLVEHYTKSALPTKQVSRKWWQFWKPRMMTVIDYSELDGAGKQTAWFGQAPD